MATQLSAITMIGTTGQGYNDGMRFIQFYFALPLAMVILSRDAGAVLLQLRRLHRLRVPRAPLRREDAHLHQPAVPRIARHVAAARSCPRRRSCCRSCSDGTVTQTALAITMPAVLYTMFGGVQAVTWTDVKIWSLIVFGMFAVVVAAILGLPAGVGLADGAQHRRGDRAACGPSTSRSISPTYTFWSGTIAALFLFCSYFGTDQSQVQRYLTARSVDEARASLLMSAYWKIPLQAARAPGRRPGVRLLRVQPAAAALQSRARRARGARDTAPAYARPAVRVRRGVCGQARQPQPTGHGAHADDAGAERLPAMPFAQQEAHCRSVRRKAADSSRRDRRHARRPT